MSRNYEFSSKNDTQDAIFFNDISKWSIEKVCDWLKEYNLSQYIDNFRTNKINGYDLCFLSNHDLLNEINVTSFHDRNSILKIIREALLMQCKL